MPKMLCFEGVLTYICKFFSLSNDSKCLYFHCEVTLKKTWKNLGVVWTKEVKHLRYMKKFFKRLKNFASGRGLG